MRKLLIYLLRKLTLLLVKTGIVSFGKDRKYVVHTVVYLDGKKKIHEFPSDLMATSRRAAKRRVRESITVTSGTTAIKGKELKHRYHEYYVQLYVRYEGHIIHSFAVPVPAIKSRDAKFGIKDRLSYTIKATALEANLKKHA